MLIPLSTDRPPKRRPRVNESLILVNLLVYLFAVAGHQFDWFGAGAIAAWGHFDPGEFRAWQLVTYQFIHDPFSVWHVLFNLVFLWVFGNAVEGRLGRLGYLGFYLIAGAVAGLAHGAISPSPVIGASGSVAGVSGAFLALFPRANIRVLVVFLVIGLFNVPASLFIMFYFVVDVLRQGMEAAGVGDERVAYAAHIAGYIYGFAVAVALLALRILPREEMDVFYLFKQMRRRKAFRAAVSQHPGAWDQPKPPEPGSRARGPVATNSTPSDPMLTQRRAEVSALIEARDLPAAAAKYRALLADAPDTIMPEQRQLDLANQLYEEGDVAAAARAYELLLRAFPGCRQADEVRLILALIYTRREPKPERAKQLLGDLLPRLRGDHERSLAQALMAELA